MKISQGPAHSWVGPSNLISQNPRGDSEMVIDLRTHKARKGPKACVYGGSGEIL